MGSLFIFTRDVPDGGRTLRQMVTVFAEDRASAERILEDELTRTREIALPAIARIPHTSGWHVERVALDQSKVVRAAVTR
jgi:hypothetical protein